MILLLPCFFLLLRTMGLPGAWFAMWIAETAAMLYVIWAMKRELQQKCK